MFYDICNAEIAQCRQRLDIILVISYFKIEIIKKIILQKCDPKLKDLDIF